jgi:hypothetical protein
MVADVPRRRSGIFLDSHTQRKWSTPPLAECPTCRQQADGVGVDVRHTGRGSAQLQRSAHGALLVPTHPCMRAIEAHAAVDAVHLELSVGSTPHVERMFARVFGHQIKGLRPFHGLLQVGGCARNRHIGKRQLQHNDQHQQEHQGQNQFGVTTPLSEPQWIFFSFFSSIPIFVAVVVLWLFFSFLVDNQGRRYVIVGVE